MSTWIKAFIISIGFLAVLIVFLAAGLHFYMKTDHAQELVISKINENLPGMISWQDLGISTLTGSIEIQGGKITGPQGEELITCDKLSLDLSLLRLLQGEIFIEEAVIDKPWVYLGLDRDNRLMLMRAFSDQKERGVPKDRKEQKGFPFNIIVDDLVISGGKVLFETVEGSVVSDLSGINITADANLFLQSVNLSLHVAKVNYISNEIKGELQKIFAKASLKKNRIESIVIQAQTASSRLRMEGSVKDIYENPFFDLACDFLVSLPELKDVLGLKQEFQGDADISIKAEGILDNPDIHTHLRYSGGLLADKKVDSANLDIRLKNRVVALEDAHIAFASGDISLQGQADLRRAFPSGFLAGKKEIDAVTYNFKADAQGIKIEEFMPDGLVMRGTLDPVVSLAGTGISPDNLAIKVSAEMDIKKLAIDDVLSPIDVSMKTQGSIQEKIIQVDTLEAGSGQSTLKANALVDLPSEKIDALVKLNVQDLKQGLSPFGIDGDGSIGLTARISQTITKPALEFSLNGEKVSLANISLGNIVCTAYLDRSGNLKVSDFVLENQGSMIKGSGTMKIFEEFLKFRLDAPVNAAAALTDVELQDFMNSYGLKGSFDGELSLEGALNFPAAKLSLKGRDVSIGSARLGDIHASSHFEQGTIEVDQIIVRNRNSRMNMTGTVEILDMITGSFYEDPPVRLSVVGDPVFLEDVVDEFKGRLVMNAAIQGSIKNPRGSLNLSGAGIDAGFQKIDKIKISSRIKDKRLTVDNLDIVLAENEKITGSGWISLEKEYAFELKSTGISLENIRTLESNRIIRGRARLNASGRGTIEDPGLKAQIVLADVFMYEKKFDDLVINLNLEDHTAKISGSLNFGFNGSYQLKTREFSASADFDHTDLTPYFQIAQRPGLTGKVDGKIHASGNAHDLGNLEALVDLTYVDLFFKDKEILHTNDLKISLTRETLSVPGAHLVLGKHGWLDVEGEGDLHGAVSLRANGDIPLIVVQPFVENVTNLEGRMLVSANIEGAGPGRDIQADIRMEGIGMNIPLIEERLRSTSGHITITPEMVLFESIAGKFGKGSFDLAGKMELKNILPQRIGLKFNARSLPIHIPDTLDLYADMEILVQGTPEESIMQGKAILLEGTYYRDVKLSLIKGLRTLVERRPPVRSPRKQIAMPFLKNMNLDVSVKRRNPLYVDNNIAQLDINPDLVITGTLNNPVINGRASVVSGTVEFRNRTFTVTKGVVDFLNPYRTEATIDISSEVTVRDWKIYLDIAGTPETLNVSLRSDPPEEDNDIVSLLVFGKTSRELIAGEGGNTQSTSAMIAYLVATEYGEDFKEATGLDIFEIESGTAQEDTADAVRVTIGKELSRRITLKYAMESKDSELSQRAIAEYKLLENILVNGFQDTRGIFGADVQLRMEFR